jgi:DNA-directed RNA polymerase specialized sigma24 family protein
MSTRPSAAFGPDLREALVAMVRRRVPESEVEDIVQSTLADALGSPHAPADSESLRRWVFGVAKNKVVDYHRRAGRETFEMPDVPGRPAPHVEADLLRWAEKHLPPGDENKTTLDWMLREGEGEKLEWIAETESVPAPRVRQRVSRLRRHLKTHWKKEVALLATLGVLITSLLLVLDREKRPVPIANEDIARAEELRKVAFESCTARAWAECVEKLDMAKRLDPAGDTRPEVQRARRDANEAVQEPTLTPAPTLTPPPPAPERIEPRPIPTESFAPTAIPSMAPSSFAPPSPKKMAPSKMMKPTPQSSDFDSDSSQQPKKQMDMKK